MSANTVSRIARQIDLSGCVQGIGLRPAVARLAADFDLSGNVANTLSGVEITVEGSPENLQEFLQRLPDCLPGSTELREMRVREIVAIGQTHFIIQESFTDLGPTTTPLPRDTVACEECLSEVATSGNRREDYPFTSCTNCGPRFSIVTDMPFERSRTELAQFPLCPQCRAEYLDPLDRRFHAQTIACPMCGPQVWATDRTGQTIAERGSAIALVSQCIQQGGIVAMCGIGGYQLLCDATNQHAVTRLRERKHRRAKPFAVMVSNVEAARRLAEVDQAAREALVSLANPIVLLPVRSDSGLAKDIHPGLNTLGVMLPTSPLHWLLLRDCDRPLVVTSGNLEGRPLESTPKSAQIALADVAVLWLHHDRPIRQELDDSVVRIIARRPVTLRLGRGLAPLPLPIGLPGSSQIFAVGGHQKSAFALTNGGQAVLGPHIGDLDGIETRERYVQHANQLNHLYRLRPEIWVHDSHPGYFTTEWARTQSGQHIVAQHHHAHIVAGMLEHGWLDREVLGVAFDGTGSGPDRTIWGGEFLQATVQGFRRVAHLRSFPLLGGDAAIREPLRVAIALAHQSVSIGDPGCGLNLVEQEAAVRVRPLLANPRFSINTSSAGRLFDGVAALVLGVTGADFEGQPAQLLEAISDPSEAHGYTFSLIGDDVLQIDWRPMIREMLSDRTRGVSPSVMSMRFHRGLAQAIATVCGQFEELPIVLSGGVFQNRLLVELLVEHLRQHPQPMGLPGIIPPNDGGLAAGQLAIGLWARNSSPAAPQRPGCFA